MVQTRSRAKVSNKGGLGGASAAGKLPNEFFYELLTSLDWTYGQLGLFKRVSKGWKDTIDASPKLDAILFREQPSAAPNDPNASDPKITHRIHPILTSIDDIRAASLDQVTILGCRGQIHHAVDLVEAMSQQAFSPPETHVKIPLSKASLLSPGGITVRDLLKHELAFLKSKSRCPCAHHFATIRQDWIAEGRSVTGYTIPVESDGREERVLHGDCLGAMMLVKCFRKIPTVTDD